MESQSKPSASGIAERIESLSRLERLAFLLKYADGMSITETAKILGIRREEAFEHLWTARRAAKGETA